MFVWNWYGYVQWHFLLLGEAIASGAVIVIVSGLNQWVGWAETFWFLESSSSSFIVRFPCYAQVRRFPPIKLLQLGLSNAHSFFSPRVWVFSLFKTVSLAGHIHPMTWFLGVWSTSFTAGCPSWRQPSSFPGLGPAHWYAGLHTTEAEEQFENFDKSAK